MKHQNTFDGFIHFRAPAHLMPMIHAHARQLGMTSASWLRSVIIAALQSETRRQGDSKLR